MHFLSSVFIKKFREKKLKKNLEKVNGFTPFLSALLLRQSTTTITKTTYNVDCFILIYAFYSF